MQGHVGPPGSAEPYPHGRLTLLSRGCWALGSQWSAGTRSDLAVGPRHDPRPGTLEVTQAVGSYFSLIPLACSDLTHGT